MRKALILAIAGPVMFIAGYAAGTLLQAIAITIMGGWR